MEPKAHRDEDAYWRRRVIILAAGMVILGLLAWALSGSSGARQTAAARESALAQVRAANALPSAAYGPSPAPVPDVVAGPSVSPAASRSPGSPRASASSGKARHGKARHKAKKNAKARRRGQSRAADWCPAGSVVMTLFSAKPSYAPAERPVFHVYAVSMSSAECAFRFGPGAVRVLVTMHGRVVWNSAECRPAVAGRAHMVRGVPVVMSVAWNRRAGYGCRGWLGSHTRGRLTAIARAGRQSSPATYFELVG